MVYGINIRPRRWTTLPIAHYSATTIRPPHSKGPIRRSAAVLVFTCINQSNVVWGQTDAQLLWSTRTARPSADMP